MKELNHWIDQYNLFETSYLRSQPVKFKRKQQKERYSYLDFTWLRCGNHQRLTRTEKQEYLEYETQKDVIIFVINGNQGAHEQFPIIMNHVENYTNYLHELQKTEELRHQEELDMTDLKYCGPKSKTHFNLLSYGYKFDLQM